MELRWCFLRHLKATDNKEEREQERKKFRHSYARKNDDFISGRIIEKRLIEKRIIEEALYD